MCRFSLGSLGTERLCVEPKDFLLGRLLCHSELYLLLQTSYSSKKEQLLLINIIVAWFRIQAGRRCPDGLHDVLRQTDRQTVVTHQSVGNSLPVMQLVCQLVSHAVSRSVGQSVSQVVNQPASLSIQCNLVGQ